MKAEIKNRKYEIEDEIDDDVAVVDLETTEPIPKDRNIKALEISIAGIRYKKKTVFYTKENIKDIFDLLDKANLIVGHNLFAFDYVVLQKHAGFDIKEKYKNKTYDTFRILERKTGCNIGLNDLATRNLGTQKTGKGIDAPELYKQGRIEELKEYLAQDLRITRMLFDKIRNDRHLKYSYIAYKEPFEKTVTITIDDR